MEIRHVFPILIVLGNLIYTIHAVKTLGLFLWGHPSNSLPITSSSARSTPTSTADIVLSLGWNLGLILLFCIPHSSLKTQPTKNNLNHSNWNKYARSIYVAITNSTLLLVCHFWQSVPSGVIWQFRLPTVYHEQITGSLHVLAWYLIFASSTMMDISSILGIKQVYYAHFNLGDPNYSPELKRFLTHRQHGSFVGLLLLFWLQDRMTVDRFLLATLVTLWMYWAWRPDQQDFHYQQNMWKIKRMHWQTVAPS